MKARASFGRASLAFVAAGASLSFLAAPARAGDLVTGGGGVLVGVGGNFLDKPSNRVYPTPSGPVTDTTYPGFGGVSTGVGFMGEVRFLGLVGLEIDAIRSSDRGKGEVTLNNNSFHVEIGQAAWHLPVLVKGTLPLPVFAPFVEVGREFVFPSVASAQVEPETSFMPNVKYDATASNYGLWTFGIGFELKPPIPDLDLRIPLTFRGSYNPGVSDNVAGRETVAFNGSIPTQATYTSEWKYRAYITLGVAVFF